MGFDLVADRQRARRRPLVLRPGRISLPCRKLRFPWDGAALLLRRLKRLQLYRLLRARQVGNVPCKPRPVIVLSLEPLSAALEPCGQFARGDAPEAFRLVSERAILRVEV